MVLGLLYDFCIIVLKQFDLSGVQFNEFNKNRHSQQFSFINKLFLNQFSRKFTSGTSTNIVFFFSIQRRSTYKNKIFYSISSLRLSYIFALKQASFWYGESCVSVFDEDLDWIRRMLPYSKRHLVVGFKKCTLAWSNRVMRLEQRLHFKKGRPL